MYQHFLLGKTHNTDSQSHTGQQIQALRDHPDDGGHHGDNAVLKTCPCLHILLPEQQHTNGNNSDTDDTHQFVKHAEHLRLLFFIHSLSLQSQFGDIRRRAYLCEPGIALSGNQKAAGHKLIPGLFCYLVLFACKQRLIGIDLAGKNNGIRTDLLTGFEDNDVIQHQLFSRNALLFAVPDDSGSGGVQHCELVQGFFSSQLLDNPDERVGNDDRHEGQAAERTGHDDQYRQDDEYQVKVCEQVFLDDFRGCFGRGSDCGVDIAGVALGLNLSGAQAGLYICVKMLNRFRRFLRLRKTFFPYHIRKPGR